MSDQDHQLSPEWWVIRGAFWVVLILVSGCAAENVASGVIQDLKEARDAAAE